MPLSHVVRNGIVHDGLGSAPRHADVGLDGDRIAVVGDVGPFEGPETDATGMVVAPGFINVLSHAWQTIQVDATCRSDLLQGVTTEIFGEGVSLGPTNPAVLDVIHADTVLDGVRVDFDRLSDGLDHLEREGISVNVASFIGGANLRALGAGLDDRPLTETELSRLCHLVDEEMADGALGLATALIYAPGSYARKDELVRLCQVVGRRDGLYVSHLRSEGDKFLESLEELVSIGSRSSCRAHVYHLKAGGTHNHHKMAQAINRIDEVRASGRAVTADMYPYAAAATALAAAIPPRHHEGGMSVLLALLDEPIKRREIVRELAEGDDFENLFLGASQGEGILLLQDMRDGTPTAGRYLHEACGMIGAATPAEALIDVVARDHTMTACFFVMSEANVRLGLSQPWVAICSDAETGSDSRSGETLTHPRAYGSFARILGKYCRELGLFPLQEAIRKMTSLPADTLRLKDRGRIERGAFADLVVFDPAQVADTATFENPRQYAVGMHHVFVNGVPVLTDGRILHSRPGRRLQRAR